MNILNRIYHFRDEKKLDEVIIKAKELLEKMQSSENEESDKIQESFNPKTNEFNTLSKPHLVNLNGLIQKENNQIRLFEEISLVKPEISKVSKLKTD
jgi:cell division septal protein FtsQ